MACALGDKNSYILKIPYNKKVTTFVGKKIIFLTSKTCGWSYDFVYLFDSVLNLFVFSNAIK